MIGADHLLFAGSEDNLAITAFSGEAADDGRVRLFVEVSNYGETDREVHLQVSAGAQPVIITPLSVAAGGRAQLNAAGQNSIFINSFGENHLQLEIFQSRGALSID